MTNISTAKQQCQAPPRTGYRQEIDGLRALAVIAVIINHFNKDVLPRGYLGVDIFFTISGFVITSSLAQSQAHCLSDLLSSFYARRVKRLLPALWVVVAFTVPAICFFDPEPQTSLNTAASSLLGISNIYLAKRSTDYFAPSTELNPFTHTWSLGVEEQFYLFFPIIFWVSGYGRRSPNGSRNFCLVISALTTLSLVGFVYFDHTTNPSAYFLLPTRFWEIALGSLAYLLRDARWFKPENLPKELPLLAIICIVVTVSFAFVSSQASTIIATLLTAFLLAALTSHSVGYQALSTIPAVTGGKLSYSLYLWHWPIISLSRLTIGIHWWSVPFQAFTILLAGIASFNYIETPLRHAKWSSSEARDIIISFTSSFLASLSITVYARTLPFNLFLGKQPKMVSIGTPSLTENYTLKSKNKSWTWRGKSCALEDNSEVGSTVSIHDCTLGDFDKAKRRVLVVGNSFSASFVRSFDDLVVSDNYAVVLTSSWGASVVKDVPNKTPWSKANDYYWENVIPELINSLTAGDMVIIVSDLAEFSPYRRDDDETDQIHLLVRGLKAFSGNLKSKDLSLGIVHALPFAREAGCQPIQAARQWYSPFDNTRCKMPNRVTTLARIKPLDLALISLQEQNNLVVINLMDTFCPRSACTYYSEEGTLLYRDSASHPSVEAARLSAKAFRIAIKGTASNLPIIPPATERKSPHKMRNQGPSTVQ